MVLQQAWIKMNVELVGLVCLEMMVGLVERRDC